MNYLILTLIFLTSGVASLRASRVYETGLASGRNVKHAERAGAIYVLTMMLSAMFLVGTIEFASLQ